MVIPWSVNSEVEWVLERRGLAVRLDISSVMTTNISSYCRMSTGRRGLALRLDISSVMTTNSSSYWNKVGVGWNNC
jgi:hypothetical protein